MRKVRSESLEVIDTWSERAGPKSSPASGPAADDGRWRRWRWPTIAVVLTLVAGWLVAFPVRMELTSSQVRDLYRVWSTARATDVERDALAARISSLVEGSEPASMVDGAYAALDREEAARLSALRGQLPGRWALSGGVRALHAAVSVALASEAADLQAAASGRPSVAHFPPRSLSTVRRVAAVDEMFTRHLGGRLEARQEAAVPPRLTAADGLLATLLRPSDRPLPLTLLTARGAQLWTYDLSDGTVVRWRPGLLPFAPAQWLPEPGYSVAADGSAGAAIVPDNAAAPVTPLAAVTAIVASVTPGRWWEARVDGSIVAVDRAGSVVAALPRSVSVVGTPVGEVPAGLVFSTPGIQVVDAATGGTVQVISADPDAFVLDVGGATIAWTVAFTPVASLHLTSTVTHHTIIAGPSLDRNPNGFGEEAGLAPSGDRYASEFLRTGGAGSREIGLVDTATGTYRRLAPGIGTVGSQPSISWSADGRWLVALDTDKGGGVAIDTASGATTPLRLDPTSTLLEVTRQ